MKVKAKLNSFLYLRHPKYSQLKEIEVANGTLFDLIDKIGLTPEDMFLTAVNGVMVEGDCRLSEGDEVNFFPPIGGG